MCVCVCVNAHAGVLVCLFVCVCVCVQGTFLRLRLEGPYGHMGLRLADYTTVCALVCVRVGVFVCACVRAGVGARARVCRQQAAPEIPVAHTYI